MPRRIELVPLTTYTFIGGATFTQNVQLIKYIPVSSYVSGMLEMRVAARTLGAGQSIALVLQSISMAEDEPEATYADAGAENVTTVDSSVPSALPGLVTRALSAPLPGYYRLLVRAVQGASATTMSATVSASLTLRES